MKQFLLILAFLAASLCSMAQTSSHIIQRGETIETIARAHGITTEELLKSNPEAKTFVYVGMKLTIPQGKGAIENKQIPTAISENTPPVPTSPDKNDVEIQKDVIWSPFYVNTFKKYDRGLYGFSIDGIGLFTENIGLSMAISTNLFLVDLENFVASVGFGPNVSYPLSSNGRAHLILPLMFQVTPYINEEDKTKVRVGLMSTPKVTYYLTPKVGLQLGGFISLPFVKDMQISGAFMFGLIF